MRRHVARVAILAAAGVIGVACGSHHVSAQQPVTVTVTRTAPSTTTTTQQPVRATRASFVTFNGVYGSIAYPSSFVVQAADVSKGTYIDTTIVSPVNPTILIRVDVVPTTDATPDANASIVRRALSIESGYRELSFTHGTFDGYADAIQWGFLVREHGVLLRKLDTFFIDNSGDEVAVLTQAPASIYNRWSTLFGRVQSSFIESGTSVASQQAPAPPASPQPPPSPPTSFCDTHVCIPNFDNGNGYIVQCADGEWSHSGGLPGACSYHGGETNNVYTGQG